MSGPLRNSSGESRNVIRISQETNEDDSQSNPNPQAGIFNNQMTQNFGPEDHHDMATGATEQIRNRHDMVTGVQKETHCGHDMT